MLHFVIAAGLAYLIIVAFMFFTQRSLIYFPDTSTAIPAEWQAGDMSVEKVVPEDGLALSFWYKPKTDQKLPTIVFFHGNAQHLGYRVSKLRWFISEGYGVLLVGYRGYGGNPGKPTEEGLYKDGRAALAFLKERGVASKDIVLYGESLGTAVATRMAFEMAEAGKPVRALVLESPFTSIVDVGAFHYPYLPVRWLALDKYDSLFIIGSVKTAVMVIHSRGDEVVPFGFGQKIYETAKEPKHALFVNDGGHNEPRYVVINKEVDRFIRKTALPK